MRLIAYILILLIFGCENMNDIFEQEDSLPYEYAIAEGWFNFSAENYTSAEDFFLTSLAMDSEYVPSYTQSYIGLGWCKLYYANTLFGNEHNTDRYNLRLESLDNFDLAYEELQNNSDIDAIHRAILFAGLSYSNSILMLHENFSNNSDSAINTYAESAIEYSDSLLNVNSDYYFMYDSTNVNPNNIHLLRAQMFLELENYDAAQEEISQVELSSTDVTFNLDSLYQGPGSNYDMYLYIGFRGQDKHLFKLEEYSITRTFTPLLPCLDLIVDELEISDNEVVECLDYMPSNILEYKFSIQIPSIINEASNATDCDFDWDNDQCVEEWIINMENLDEDSTCIEDGFRTLEILGNEGGLTVPGVCYGSCDACSDE